MDKHPPPKAPRRRPAKRNRGEEAVAPEPKGPGRPSLIEDETRLSAMARAASMGAPKGKMLAMVGRITVETLDQWWKQSTADKQARLVTEYTRFTDRIEHAWGEYTEAALAQLEVHTEKYPDVVFKKLARLYPEDYVEVQRRELSGVGGKPIETSTTTVVELTLPTNGFEHPDALAARAGAAKRHKENGRNGSNGSKHP